MINKIFVIFGPFLGGIVVLITLIWVFLSIFLSLYIVTKAFGFWGTFIGLFILPITVLFAPLYALFKWGDWTPFIICYGYPTIMTILSIILHPKD